MIDALAYSVASTAAEVLESLASASGNVVSDEAIGLYLWHARGFRDHNTLVTIINHARRILDDKQAARGRPTESDNVQLEPIQLSLNLRAAA